MTVIDFDRQPELAVKGARVSYRSYKGRTYDSTVRAYVSQYERKEATVLGRSFYMDNSIEVNLDNGARLTLVAAHGDAC